jgi:hypothetical protein
MYHGLVWIEAKNFPTNILVMTTILVFVWMLFGMPMALWPMLFTFLANIGQIIGNQKVNQNFG